MKKKLLSASILLVSLFFVVITNHFYTSAKSVAAFERIDIINGKVTANYLNVRQTPSTASPIVCVLRAGQTIKILGKVDGWYAIYEPGKKCVGIANGKFIKLLNEGSNTKITAQKKYGKKPSVPSTSAKPPSVGTTSTPMAVPNGISSDEQTILNLVNKARASAGVAPLSFDMNLVKVARLKAKDMVNNNYFSHQSPTYGSPFDMMRQFGVSFRTAGENIAGNQTAEKAFNAWMNSPGHKQNILNGNYNLTGIGVAVGSPYGKIFVQQFIGR